MKKITLRLINKLDPCYDPESIGFTGDLELSPLEFIEQFADKVKNKDDILWLLCRKQYISDRDMRLFAVWCAREALRLIENPDPRSVQACEVAEMFANNAATREELDTARDAAWDAVGAAARDAARAAARDAAGTAAWDAARDAAGDAAWDAAWDAARAAAWDAQIEKLKTYFAESE